MESTLRRFPRVNFKARVIAHNDEDIAYLESKTISEAGISLLTEDNIFQIGTKVKLNIKSKQLEGSFIAEGEVVSLSKKMNPNICIKFINISDTDVDHIRKYVFEKNSLPDEEDDTLDETTINLQFEEDPYEIKINSDDYGIFSPFSNLADIHKEIDNFQTFSSLIESSDKESENTESVEFFPLESTCEDFLTVYLDGKYVPNSKTDGWYFDKARFCIVFSGIYKLSPGNDIQFCYKYKQSK